MVAVTRCTLLVWLWLVGSVAFAVFVGYSMNGHSHKGEERIQWNCIKTEVELPDSMPQKEVGLMMDWSRYKRSSGPERAEALASIRKTLDRQANLAKKVEMIGVLLFGSLSSHSILYENRDSSLPVPYDSECFQSTRDFFWKNCGSPDISQPWKHDLAFANICKRLVCKEAFEEACMDTCGAKPIEDDRFQWDD